MHLPVRGRERANAALWGVGGGVRQELSYNRELWAEVLFYLGTVRSVQAGYFGTVLGTVRRKKLGTRYGTEYR